MIEKRVFFNEGLQLSSCISLVFEYMVDVECLIACKDQFRF